MADAATITLDITMLPDDIAKTLTDETFVYTTADATEGWTYKLTAITTNSTDLISKESFLQKGSGSSGTDTGSILPFVNASDKVKFLFVKNTGFTEDGTTANATDSIYIVLDGSAAAYNNAVAIEIGPGESWYVKLNSTLVGNIHCATGGVSGGGASLKKVQAIVAAIIDDIT
tara:strand:+ start:78 stop:596 length:519 start_codon:yes stop_codon:yes gene_type:complete